MKKTILYIIVIIFLVFLFQFYIINNNSLFGVKPNLILILVFMTSLLFGLRKGLIFSMITGIILDLIYGNQIPQFTIGYLIVSLVVGLINSHYIKANKTTIIFVTIYSTCIFEFINYIIYTIKLSEFPSFIFFITQIIIATLFNVCFAYILHSVMIKFYDKLDNEFNMNRGF